MGYRIYNGKTKTEPFKGYGGKIVRYPLEPSVAEWALKSLSEGRALSRALAKSLDFLQGSWSAYLPEETPQEIANESIGEGVLDEPPCSEWEAYEKASPGDAQRAGMIANDLHCSPEDLISVPKVSLSPFAATDVKRYLEGGSNQLCLLEDMAASVSDRCLLNKKLIMWTQNDDVFYPLTDPDWDINRIADAIEDSSAAWGGNFILTALPESMIPYATSSHSLTENELESLASSATHVILQAYDGESYVMWRRFSATENQ